MLMRKSELEKIKEELRVNFKYIKKTYHVKTVGIFGSFARGEQTKKSDVDILVDFSGPIGLFKYMELEFFLSRKLKRKVDLISKGGLKKVIKKEILSQTIYV